MATRAPRQAGAPQFAVPSSDGFPGKLSANGRFTPDVSVAVSSLPLSAWVKALEGLILRLKITTVRIIGDRIYAEAGTETEKGLPGRFHKCIAGFDGNPLLYVEVIDFMQHQVDSSPKPLLPQNRVTVSEAIAIYLYTRDEFYDDLNNLLSVAFTGNASHDDLQCWEYFFLLLWNGLAKLHAEENEKKNNHQVCSCFFHLSDTTQTLFRCFKDKGLNEEMLKVMKAASGAPAGVDGRNRFWWPAFVSSSTTAQKHFGPNTICIHAHTTSANQSLLAAPIRHFSAYPTEDEWLFFPLCRFKAVTVTSSSGSIYSIDAESVTVICSKPEEVFKYLKDKK